MLTYHCGSCGQLVFFENSACLRCGHPLGFVGPEADLATFDPVGDQLAHRDGRRFRRCANQDLASCNWVVAADQPGGTLCEACALTRERPSDDDPTALAAWAEAEIAKRRLLFQLNDLGLPLVDRVTDPEHGLAFDLLSSAGEPVTTGHADGVITLDLAESDDAHRTLVQQQMGEPYRTVLGHFRHEIGHYYWSVLLEPEPARLDAARELFGDDRADYAQAIDRHYQQGPPEGWEDAFVSSYATMHPYEDWAETFAHYLHIRDTLQTAAEFQIRVAGPDRGDDTLAARPESDTPEAPFAEVLDEWLPLTYALNAVNRSMGNGDLYPFVLAPTVVDKLAFVHDLWLDLRTPKP